MACIPKILKFNQLKRCVTFVRYLTSQNAASRNIPQISFIDNVSMNLKDNWWIYRQNEKIESPILEKIQVDFPNGLKYVPPLDEPKKHKVIDLPTTNKNDITKEAARLIVIRRKKMKRHKLKKLRKRMKFEWAKRRQRREWNKEKAFQAELIAQCKQGEAFNAENYVKERLAKFNEASQYQQKNKYKTPQSLVDK